jgi:uncharacterized protein YjcR
MLNSLIHHYTKGNKAKFAAKIGVSPQTLSKWLGRNTYDAEVLYRFCEGISAEWLLSGMGDMLTSETKQGHGGVSIAGNNTIAGNNNAFGNVSLGDCAVLKERVKMLEKLLEEKERLIKVLMEKK